MDTTYWAEGDFELWVSFFRYARLYPADALTGGWRFDPNSLSHGGRCAVRPKLRGDCLKRIEVHGGIRGAEGFQGDRSGDPARAEGAGIWQRALVNNLRRSLHRVPGPDWPPVIEYRYKEDKWIFRR